MDCQKNQEILTNIFESTLSIRYLITLN